MHYNPSGVNNDSIHLFHYNHHLLVTMPPQPTSNKGVPASAASPNNVAELAQKACERLAEKWYCEASKERQELEAIKKMEKQATEQKEAREHAEKARAEAACKALEEKAAKEQAEAAQKATEVMKTAGMKRKGLWMPGRVQRR
jgi:hypothetical protein